MRKAAYVIAGAGVAGVSAAAAIRELDREGEILLADGEGDLPYARPMLTKRPLASFDRCDIPLHDEGWYREQRITLLRCARVEGLDAAAKTVRVGGETIEYGRCILATGASNFVPPFAGKDLPGLCTIRTKDDIRRIKAAALLGRRCVIIGGGVIGLECAFELCRYGLEVTVLEAMPYLMPRQLDEETSRAFQSQVRDFAIHTDVKIEALEGTEAVSAVRLADGRGFPCDFVVVACGVRANVSLAREAGIAVERAIVVNERMETSAPAVFACGDCAQYQGVNAALWSQGMEQGRVAGINAAGGSAAYTGCDMSLVLNSRRIALFALGDLGQNAAGDDSYSIEVSRGAGKDRLYVNPRSGSFYEKKVYRDGKLVGAALIGNLAAMYGLKEEILGEGAKG